MGKVIRRGALARQKAIDILRNGGTIQQAAEATGYGNNYVRQLGAKEGIRFPRGKYGKRQNRKYDDEQILLLFAEGKSPKEITSILGIKSLTTVYHTLKENGVAYRKGHDVIANVMRICPRCNTVFLCHPNSNQIYCTAQCQASESHSRADYKRRVRFQNAIIDANITLKKVATNDGGLCWLCGCPVNWNDYSKDRTGRKIVHKMYPSIDHVVPLSQGGSHSWDNVRLAHIGCNSKKGVKIVG